MTDRPFRFLCREADARDTMSDENFWHHVLVAPFSNHADENAYDWSVEQYSEAAQIQVPCPECGGFGACGYDAEGRPLIHATFRDEADDDVGRGELDD